MDIELYIPLDVGTINSDVPQVTEEAGKGENAYASSVVPMIEANYEMFTVVEKTIADFFISNEKEMDFSSGRMAKMLHVSEASLSRFAKKMGYSGYREFIYNYQPSIAERPNVEEQTIHVLYSYEELLQKTYSLIREPQIKHVSQLIGEHTRIFLYGFGSSGLAAQEFQLRLLRLGMDAEAKRVGQRSYI